MHRCPQRGGAHQEVAVAAHRYRQPAGVAQRQCGANGNAGATANAATSIRADIVKWVVKRP